MLNLLADRLFHGKELARAQELAETALKHTEVAHIRAESLFLLGRVQQERADYDGAYTFFGKLCEFVCVCVFRW